MIDYHPGKANIMADVLNRKSVQTLQALNAHLSLTNNGEIVAELTGFVEPSTRATK